MSYHAARTVGADGAPLLLTFHGTGGDEAQFHDLGQALVSGAHVVSPRGDVSEMGALRYFRRTAEGVYDMEDLAQRTVAMAAFVRAEVARTGATRVIGLGYSNGANMLASVMLAHPGMVTEAVLMHPLIPWAPDPDPTLHGTKVLITAGEQDPICPAPATHALIETLTQKGATVSAHWHQGGHQIAQSEVGAVQAFLAG